MANEALIPIKDENSQAFNELFDRLGTLDLRPLLVYLIDNAESSALPHLAEQFHVMGNEGWLQVKTDAEKRDLIKQAINIHKYKGTKYGILRVLEMLNLEGEIKEWFEYGGKPFYFSVDINFVSRGLDEVLINKLEDLINEYKNERSKIDSLNIFLACLSGYVYALCSLTGESITVYPKPNILLLDESNWDLADWGEHVSENIRIPHVLWDETWWEENSWAFG